jgi:predicted component of type VI protein secretion system
MQSTYCDKYEEYVSSVIDEIENILSCRLKSKGSGSFNYGVFDLLSVGIESGSLEKFRLECQRIIKKLEPRISEVEITNVTPDNNNQTLELTMVCVLRETGRKIYPRIVIC